MRKAQGERVRIAIIADDLTSAADGGIQFAQGGLQAVVTMDAARVIDFSVWPVVAVDADSRCRTAAEAAVRIASCVRALRGRELLYKTVDSTIRGHLAVELRAAKAESGRSRMLLAPAFPAAGRTTRGGRQYLDGVPLSRTTFSQDAYHPVLDDDLSSILASAGFNGVRILSRTSLRDSGTVAAALKHSSCVIADAETDEDLQTLVAAVGHSADTLWAGSPGLAAALGRSMARNRDGVTAQLRSRRILVAVGSLNPASRRQLEALRDQPSTVVIEVDANRALRNPADAGCAALEVAAVSTSALRGAETIVITTSGAAGPRMSRLAPGRAVDAIARTVEILHAIEPFDGFILTGGDTAACVAHRLGVTGIQLNCEFRPGVPVGTFMGACSARVLTKAGGFGSDRTLIDACAFLRGVVTEVSTRKGDFD
jgi:D-threonate/D-erythronate kinase